MDCYVWVYKPLVCRKRKNTEIVGLPVRANSVSNQKYLPPPPPGTLKALTHVIGIRS